MSLPSLTRPVSRWTAACVLLLLACGRSTATVGSDGGKAPGSTPGTSQPGTSTPPQGTSPGWPLPGQPNEQEPPQEEPPPPAYTRTWVVSPGGDDGAEGSEEAPFRTVGRGLLAASPGERVLLKAGTYRENLVIGGSVRAGTATSPIVLEGEEGARLVPATSSRALVDVARPHWRLQGLTLDAEGQPVYAVAFYGDTDGSVLADSELANGTFGAGVSVHGGATNVTIEGNHIYNFRAGLEDSHGILVQTTSRNTVVRNNVIHGNSGDGIQCIGPEGYNNNAPADGLLIENNDIHSDTEQAVDIKTCFNVVVRHNRLHHYRRDPVRGGNPTLVVHYSAHDVWVEDNDMFDAGLAMVFGGTREGPLPTRIWVRRNFIHDMTTEGGMYGGGIIVQGADSVVIENNTFTRLSGPALMVGNGSGGDSQNLVVRNNIFDVASVLEQGGSAWGLSFSHNLYLPGARFTLPDGARDASSWLGLGSDSGSLVGQPQLNPDTLVPGALAVDQGVEVGLPYCGQAPDIGAVETGCT